MSKVIAIDGPSGAGKSSVSRIVGEKLGFLHVDSGALYRIMTWQALARKVDTDDPAAIAAFAPTVDIECRPEAGRIAYYVNGEAPGDRIRTPEINAHASKVATVKEVRDRMTALLRGMTAYGNLVVEGRDITTAVFPDSPARFYLTASAEARARRRQKEEVEKGIANQSSEAVRESLLARDRMDSTRKYAPLRKADGAVEIDSSDLTLDQVVQTVLGALPADWVRRGYTCVVCVKQVPDTKKVTGEAMKPDGTINRAALPAIFNPEDLNALEAALSVKERCGGRVIAVAMGLPAACAVLREALMRGADEAYLVTDRRAAGSDTLATSYILSQAVKKFNPDFVFCGRQAIDGDTAQTGPQIAEKLGVPAITYLEKIVEVKVEGEGKAVATVVRDIGTGVETDRVTLPALFTVTEKFGEARPMDVRRVMKYKDFEPQQLSCDDIGCEADRCGFAGSPTSVNKIVSVVLAGGAYKPVEPTDEGLGALVRELVAEHTIG